MGLHRRSGHRRELTARAFASYHVSDEPKLETNLAAHSRLDPELVHLDLRLQLWAPWARPHYGSLGYPTRAVTERANEGGLLAKDMTPVHAPEWPMEIVVADQKIAALPTRHMAAVMANYWHLAWEWRRRAEVYAVLSRFLARTRPLHVRAVGASSAGPDTFRRDLDRARWTLKALLQL